MPLSLQFELPSVGQPLLWPLLEPFFQQHHQLGQPVVEAARSNAGVLAVPDVLAALVVLLLVLLVLLLQQLQLLLMLLLLLLLLLLRLLLLLLMMMM